MSSEHAPLGLDAFGSLRAEDEPWLARAFIEPYDFPIMAGPGSVIIYGEGGGGKSAVMHMLRQRIETKTNASQGEWIPVLWRPEPLAKLDRAATSERWRTEILGQCALSLLEHYAQRPSFWEKLPEWPKNVIVMFIEEHLSSLFQRDVFSIRMDIFRIRTEAPPEGRAWLEGLRFQNPVNTPFKSMSVTRVVDYLVQALHAGGCQGLWIMADGFEQWQDMPEADLSEHLRYFLSSLVLFDQPGFAFKLAVPVEWRGHLGEAHAVRTRRVAECLLSWEEEALIELVEKRLSLALGREPFRLDDLCLQCNLAQWLARFGGRNPRRWLSWVRAIYHEYTRRDESAPLKASEWRKLQRRLAPRLRLTRDGKVYVGPERKHLSPALYRMLEYLYVQDGRICSRQELYTAYTQDETVSSGWEKVMDTALWRLRKAIEPDPARPIFIISERGRGVRLARTE